MSSSTDFSKILYQAYDQFLLPLGSKKVPTPYRRNEIDQEVGSEFQGKSSPKVLTETTIKLAREQNFDLEKASIEEIRDFMRKNKLGIDCSGFAYRILDYLVKEVKGKTLADAGFPHVGRTNVAKLTSDEFSLPVADFKSAQPGDLVRLNSGEDVQHCIIVLENTQGIITYAHSSGETTPNGVHQGKIVNGQFPKDLQVFSFNQQRGDGIRRLKALWSSAEQI